MAVEEKVLLHGAEIKNERKTELATIKSPSSVSCPLEYLKDTVNIITFYGSRKRLL
ncbi:MAG: hypothetical protein U0K36_04595 [Bacteroidales bacterium]|nr:hypothetical protein [Bacteroidales bacterium]